MVSIDLVTLSLCLSEYSATGMVLTAEGVAELTLALDDLAGQARQLEEGVPAYLVGRARATSAPPWGWSDKVVVALPQNRGGEP